MFVLPPRSWLTSGQMKLERNAAAGSEAICCCCCCFPYFCFYLYTLQDRKRCVCVLFAGKWCCVTGWSNLGAGCGIYHLCSSHSWTQLRSCCRTMLELSHMTRSDAHFRVDDGTVLVHKCQWPADHTWLKETQVWSACYYDPFLAVLWVGSPFIFGSSFFAQCGKKVVFFSLWRKTLLFWPLYGQVTISGRAFCWFCL